MRKRVSRPPVQVFSVTGLPTSLQDDQDERIRRYLVSMGIRTLCFILAVVALAGLHWTLIGWCLVVAAVILPYVAVVMANAAKSQQGTVLGAVTPENPAPPQLSTDRSPEDPPR